MLFVERKFCFHQRPNDDIFIAHDLDDDAPTTLQVHMYKGQRYTESKKQFLGEALISYLLFRILFTP